MPLTLYRTKWIFNRLEDLCSPVVFDHLDGRIFCAYAVVVGWYTESLNWYHNILKYGYHMI